MTLLNMSLEHVTILVESNTAIQSVDIEVEKLTAIYQASNSSKIDKYYKKKSV
jgi:hypothetical protein